jgi:hypothetical protein
MQVTERQPLMEAGLDSLGTVELRNALGDHFQIDLPATFVFDYPSAAAVAEAVAQLLTQRSMAALEALEQQRASVQAPPPHFSQAATAAAVAEVVQSILGSVRPDQARMHFACSLGVRLPASISRQ